uniref:TERF1-interacting nuclear factor 2 N-terminal domain-containing protein n=1 Tax=Electrophorus electricus TaxID=8005 RepID=A0A4W4FCQ3_ELEEL
HFTKLVWGMSFIRAVSAEAWMVIQTRDIKHFERLMEFLDVTQILLPHLVTSIKHMKIMFGLKTLVRHFGTLIRLGRHEVVNIHSVYSICAVQNLNSLIQRYCFGFVFLSDIPSVDVYTLIQMTLCTLPSFIV